MNYFQSKHLKLILSQVFRCNKLTQIFLFYTFFSEERKVETLIYFCIFTFLPGFILYIFIFNNGRFGNPYEVDSQYASVLKKKAFVYAVRNCRGVPIQRNHYIFDKYIALFGLYGLIVQIHLECHLSQLI